MRCGSGAWKRIQRRLASSEPTPTPLPTPPPLLGPNGSTLLTEAPAPLPAVAWPCALADAAAAREALPPKNGLCSANPRRPPTCAFMMRCAAMSGAQCEVYVCMDCTEASLHRSTVSIRRRSVLSCRARRSEPAVLWSHGGEMGGRASGRLADCSDRVSRRAHPLAH